LRPLRNNDSKVYPLDLMQDVINIPKISYTSTFGGKKEIEILDAQLKRQLSTWLGKMKLRKSWRH
jgi:hypothetical protein